MWSIHMVEYHVAIKRKKALTHTAMWMHLEDPLLIQRGQTQKDT